MSTVRIRQKALDQGRALVDHLERDRVAAGLDLEEWARIQQGLEAGARLGYNEAWPHVPGQHSVSVRIDGKTVTFDPASPCPFLPGTAHKIAWLEARAGFGLTLFHPLDASEEGSDSGQPFATP